MNMSYLSRLLSLRVSSCQLGGCLSIAIAAVCATPVFAASPPTFTDAFANDALVPTNSLQKVYAPNLSFPAGQPVQTSGPGEATNATQIYVRFVSDSLGNTNLSAAAKKTGFNLAGTGVAKVPGIVDPPTNPNANNLYFTAVGPVKNNQAWLQINYIPGTNAAAVPNRLELLALNGNDNQNANWSITNLNLIVRPAQLPPPSLEVRFYNSSANAPADIYLLPTSKGLEGVGFWWSSNGVHNSWTNWMTRTTNMTVTLADIGISGTNTQGQPYYSVHTTNFPNAAWFVSYKGGHLMAPTNGAGQWNGITYGAGPNKAQPTAANTNGLWFGSEWNAFELTLDGNPEDVGDTTYINQFSIPMVMRVFTNDYANAQAGVYTNLNSDLYYQVGGWTNFNSGHMSNVVAQMKSAFPNGVISNAAGKAVMIPGPSSAGSGALLPPWTRTSTICMPIATRATLASSSSGTIVRTMPSTDTR